MSETEILISSVISYFMITGWLYMIAKYHEDSFPLGAFIPVVNLSMIVRLAGHWSWTLFLMLWLGVFSMMPIFSIALLIVYQYLVFRLWSRTLGDIRVSILAVFLPIVWFPVMWFLMRKKHIDREKKRKANAESIVVICSGCKKNLRVKSTIKGFICPSCSVQNTVS